MGRNPLTKSTPVASISRGAEKGAAAASSEISGGLVRLLPPWGVAGALPLAALITEHLWAAPGVAPWAAMGMTTITGVVSAVAWKISHARRMLGRLHVTINTAAALGWITVATQTGPFTRPVIDFWVAGGFSLALSWNIRHAVRKTEGAGGELDQAPDAFATWWRQIGAKKSGLEGVPASTRAITADTATIDLALAGTGHTPGDVEKAREHIAVEAGIPRNGVRTVEDPRDAGHVTMTLVRRDLLGQVTAWPGPRYVGGSALDPVVYGRYEDGDPLSYVLPATPAAGRQAAKNAVHVGISGQNGAGKSGVSLITAGEYLTRPESEVWVIDTVKRLQTFGPIADLLDWFEIEEAGARKMLKHLKAAVRARSDYLGARGLPDWRPGCGLTHITVIIEEAADVGGIEEVVKLVQQLRSLGINMIVSAQRWSFDNIPTSLRAEITAAFVFGADSTGDAEFLLGDLAAAGADPGAWGADHPGRCYVVAPGIAPERRIMPARLEHAEPGEVNRLVRPHVHSAGGVDPITAGATPYYAARTRWPAGGSTASGWTPTTATSSTSGGPAAGEAPMTLDLDLDGVDDGDQFVSTEPDLDPDIQPHIDDPIVGGEPIITFAGPPKAAIEASPEQARAALDAFIAARRTARQTFTPRDIKALAASLGKTRSWSMHELRRRVSEGELATVDGRYQAHDLNLVDA